ncbi:hypothetical protein DCAR_0936126 [Daucus carota subsp. sativus]|uniref:Cyanovirin-N domain-containing protein n=1 Tax=Daucus carota subsp. sativus TaxID=79200 RepID=A0A175YJZ8_DAUCS|nr:hypothetical protein DCAR_0936126 [Daucus carota subsp. sativus]
MAFLNKLNIVVIVLMLLSFYGARITSASSLHQRDEKNWRWITDCRIGHRKLGLLNCESGGEIRNSRCFSHCRSGNRKLDILNCEIAGEKHNSRWFSDCRIGHRKLGLLNCETGGASANMDRAFWSESLKTSLSPPPAPVVGVPPHSRSSNIASPPRKY